MNINYFIKFLKIIKNLSFFIGTPAKFEIFLKQISNTTALTHLNLINISSFVLYEFQIILIDQLPKFLHLKQLIVEHYEFHLTDKLLRVLAKLENLTSIKISTRKNDDLLFKINSFNNLNKVNINLLKRQWEVGSFGYTYNVLQV